MDVNKTVADGHGSFNQPNRDDKCRNPRDDGAEFSIVDAIRRRNLDDHTFGVVNAHDDSNTAGGWIHNGS